MNRIKDGAQLALSEYHFVCDRSRWDEALALVGGLVVVALVAYLGLWLLCVVSSLAGCGTSVLGVPMLAISRFAWARRTR